jgi:hypothetical protein
MLRRLLNIASAVCLVACVALMGVWVRSYRWEDFVAFAYTKSESLTADSAFGEISFLHLDGEWAKPYSKVGYIIEHRRVTAEYLTLYRISVATLDDPSFLGFRWGLSSYVNSYYLQVPFWFPVLCFAALAGLPWYWQYLRFSLRTLLIAMTLATAILGMIAWLDRAWMGK